MKKHLKMYTDYLESLAFEDLVCESRKIDSSTKSTTLMTRLRHRFDSGSIDSNCNDPIDFLFLRKYYTRSYYGITLVVTYADVIPKDIYAGLLKEGFKEKTNCITFTDLKKSRASFWDTVDENRGFVQLSIDEHSSINVWNRPFELEAVTNYDKNFGKIWHYDELVDEGNNWGDTSTFLIIGSLNKHR